ERTRSLRSQAQGLQPLGLWRSRPSPMRPTFLPLLILLLAVMPAPAAEPPAKNTPLDRAVDRALAYLHNTQDRTDGAWRAGNQKNPAITSLAVMAFLSAGHVPGEGRYGPTLEKGVRW